jgi:uncharacterized ferredoxin-like protein
MSIHGVNTVIDHALRDVAERMVLAAKTAPKGRGEDQTVMAVVSGEEIARIAAAMREIGKRYDSAAFLRDAESLSAVSVLVLFGTRIKSLGLKKCGMCGFANCDKKNAYPDIPCVFNTGDLGIAIGSAVSVAMDCRADNRVMYTAGQAVVGMKMLGADVKIVYAVPLSGTSKNPFFDRK